MNDDSDYPTKAGEKAGSLNRKSKDPIRGHRREASRRQYLALKADPVRYARHLNNVKRWRQAHPDYQHLWRQRHPDKQNPARKSYIAAWKAAHPERLREYERRWKLKKGIKVGSRTRLTHEQSLQRMREILEPFSAKQFAQHIGITHGGACNLFRTLTATGKIQVVKKERWARLYEVSSSVPAIPAAEMVAGGAP